LEPGIVLVGWVRNVATKPTIRGYKCWAFAPHELKPNIATPLEPDP